MDRILKVHIDRTTWPNPGIPPLFPKSFKSGLSSYNMNIPAMLMMIGYLTTPTSSTGVSLSEFWAWVRYLAAISNQPDLSLTQTYAELDAHQKTILSDDFGMGVPILWLCDKLSLVQIVDGRYFMQRIAPLVGVTQRRTAKRGPNKTPDFLARDASGKWHIIECKGMAHRVLQWALVSPEQVFQAKFFQPFPIRIELCSNSFRDEPPSFNFNDKIVFRTPFCH